MKPFVTKRDSVKTAEKELMPGMPGTCAAGVNAAGVRICPLSGLPCRCKHLAAVECPCLAMAKALKKPQPGCPALELTETT